MKKIAIIGSGVVGKATGQGLLAWGHDVVFYDNNQLVLSDMKERKFEVCEIEDCLSGCEVFMVSVSTPTVDGQIELKFIQAAMATLGNIIKAQDRYPVVVIRSTVPPGTTEDLLIPILEEYSHKKAGQHFGVAMNPEFLRERSAQEDFADPRIIIVGSLDGRTQEIMEEVYRPVNTVKKFTSIRTAEMEKYGHNLWNAVKISFCNEIREICEMLDLEADEILELVMESAEASWNPTYGTRNMGPFGGTCLPKDTQAFLSWTRHRLDKRMVLLEAVIRVNESMKVKYGT